MSISFDHIQQEISAMLSVNDEDLTEEQKKAMDEYLSELGDQEATKIDSFSAFVREETARALYYKEEAKRLANKAKNAENRIGFLKAKYLDIMRENGVSKIKGNAYTLSIRHIPHVVVDDDAKLDDLYMRIIPEKREPDKVVIREALKGGVSIPGCRIEETDSLQIR